MMQKVEKQVQDGMPSRVAEAHLDLVMTILEQEYAENGDRRCGRIPLDEYPSLACKGKGIERH